MREKRTDVYNREKEEREKGAVLLSRKDSSGLDLGRLLTLVRVLWKKHRTPWLIHETYWKILAFSTWIPGEGDPLRSIEIWTR